MSGRGIYLCPTGLVSTGGKSGVKVTSANTVRGSALLSLIPSIPSWPRGMPSSTVPHGRSLSSCCHLGRSRRQCLLGFHCHVSVITHQQTGVWFPVATGTPCRTAEAKVPIGETRGESLTLEQPGQGGAVRDGDEWSCLEVGGKLVNRQKYR